jgi:hypothetical protein
MNAAVMRLGTSVGVALILLGSRGPYAQGQDKNPLARVKTLKCTFSVYASGNWKSGDPRGEVKAEDVVLQVEGIDAQEGTAQIVGADATHITALLTASSLHLLERSMAGNLTVTTVFAQANAKGKLRAVRSQHDYIQMAIPGFISEPTVTQRYGECEAGH